MTACACQTATMPVPRFQVVPAVYVILLREGPSGPEVLLQQRRDTGYMDRWWACGAAGHVEAGESVLEAAVREAREELDVVLDPAALEPLTTLHRHIALSSPLEERYDSFVVARRWEGEPRLMEPEKAHAMVWAPLHDITENVVPHEAEVLRMLADAEAGGEPVPALLERGFDQSLTLVVARGTNGAIGRDGQMPWHLPEDLRHFQRTTRGGTLIMGRKTFESIGRPLPGRTTIVLTRDAGWQAGGPASHGDPEGGPLFPQVLVARTWAEALLMAGDREVFVLGGSAVFADALPVADRLVVTEVDQAPEDADTFFPEIGPQFEPVSRTPGEGFTIVEYRRVPSASGD